MVTMVTVKAMQMMVLTTAIINDGDTGDNYGDNIDGDDGYDTNYGADNNDVLYHSSR